ncbi:MAG: nucleoside deaminase [Bacillota bacterium]
MAWRDHEYYIKRAVELSKSARESGNTPFGAVLVDSEGEIILEQENIELTEQDCTGHAETTLVKRAAKEYSADFLWDCTLYSSAEPCVMCAGAIYWSNVGRVVYGISEKKLLELTGDHEVNPTFDLPCREVFASGQKDITVIGPFEELEAEIIKPHQGYWD